MGGKTSLVLVIDRHMHWNLDPSGTSGLSNGRETSLVLVVDRHMHWNSDPSGTSGLSDGREKNQEKKRSLFHYCAASCYLSKYGCQTNSTSISLQNKFLASAKGWVKQCRSYHSTVLQLVKGSPTLSDPIP